MMTRTLDMLLTLVAVVLVIVAILTNSIRYLATDYLEVHQHELLTRISDHLQQPLEAESIKLGWHFGGFRLHIEKFALMDKSRRSQVLKADHMHLKFGYTDFFNNLNLIPNQIQITGVKLTLLRDQDGRFSLYGLDRSGDESGAFLDFLLQPDRIIIDQLGLSVHDLADKDKPIVLNPVSLQIDNQGARHLINLAVPVDDAKQGKLFAIADFHAGLDDPLLWTGNLYLRSVNLDLASLLVNRLKAFDINVQNTTADVEAWTTWEKGQVKQSLGRFLVKDLDFEILKTKTISIKLNEISSLFHWQPENEKQWRLVFDEFSLNAQGTDGPKTQLVVATSTTGQEIHATANAILLSDLFSALGTKNDNVFRDIKTSRFNGRLSNLRLSFSPQRLADWQLSSDFSEVQSKGARWIPEMNNIKGSLRASQRFGNLMLDMQKSSVFLKRLFRDAIPVDRLQARLDWAITDKKIILRSDDLSIDNADIKTRTAFALLFQRGKPPWLNLQSTLSDGDGSKFSRYLPARYVPPKSLEWLDNGIVDGYLRNADVKIKGYLQKAMFQSTDHGLFHAVGQIENAILKPHPDWPLIDQLKGKLTFFGNTLKADVENGRFLQMSIFPSHADMTLMPLSPVHVRGTVEEPLESVMRIFSETPLKDKFSALPETLAVKGKPELAIDIAIPVKKVHKLRLNIMTELNKADISLLKQDIAFDQVSGKLHITEEGITSDHLDAHYKGNKIQASLTRQLQGTFLNATMQLTDSQISKLVGHSLPLRGGASFDIAVELPSLNKLKGYKPQIAINSNLTGMEVNLPLSLYKTAKASRKLAIIWKTDAPDALQISYPHLNSVVDSKKKQITGSINTKDIRGNFHYSYGRKDKFNIKLKKLALNFKLGNAKSTPKGSNLSPLSIPPLKIDVADLLLNGEPMGALHLETGHLRYAHQIKTFRLVSKKATLEAKGDWTRYKGVSTTDLNLHIDSKRLGDVLQALGISSDVKKAEGTVKSQLSWPGSPADFSLARVVGEIYIRSSEGSLVTAEPGIGRLLGLISVSALKRRIKLDFKDFTSKGFVFDKIKSKILLNHGQAKLKDTVIKGPAGDIYLDGLVYLNNQTLDLRAKVYPDIQGALPLIAAVTTGPASAAVMLILKEIAGKEIDKIGRIKYTITGNWNKPVIERRKRKNTNTNQEDENGLFNH